MSKVITTRLNSGGGTRGGRTSVDQTRVRDPKGHVKRVWTLDAGSRTFGADLKYVFSKNVAKARRDNRRVIGAADVGIPKR
jgi:hypothetical protein